MEMEIKALLVDDEEQCVKTLQDGIDWKVLGVAETFGAYNAVQAREIMKEEMSSLILCDIEMPGESGLEFISSVREKADLNDENIECIILTCYPDYKFMRKAMQIGCSDYLIKPIDTDEMTAVLEKAVEKIQKKFQKDEKEKKLFPDAMKTSFSEGQQNIIDGKVIPYIQEHFSETLTVTEIADYAALNAQYMMRLFKKRTGISVLEYVTNCRMEKAKELLAEAGYPDGEGFPVVEYLYNTSEAHKAVAEALQFMWEDVLGVTVTLNNQEWVSFIDSRKKGDYSIARHGWIADYNDPMTFIDMWETGGGNNDAKYSNADYDALLDQIRGTMDQGERMKLMHEAEDLVIGQDYGVCPLYFYTQKYMLSDGIKGLHYTTLGYFFFGHTSAE